MKLGGKEGGGGLVAKLALRLRHDTEQGKTLSGRYTSDCPDLPQMQPQEHPSSCEPVRTAGCSTS